MIKIAEAAGSSSECEHAILHKHLGIEENERAMSAEDYLKRFQQDANDSLRYFVSDETPVNLEG